MHGVLFKAAVLWGLLGLRFEGVSHCSVMVRFGRASLLRIGRWLARRRGLPGASSLRENQFAVLGDAQPVVRAVVADHDLVIAAE